MPIGPSPHIGSSPRVRGTVDQRGPLGVERRFIPARAGNSWRPTWTFQNPSVHPRACGEQYLTRLERQQLPGSSPRVRGTVEARGIATVADRFIPARAGNSQIAGGRIPQAPVHPRACGEQAARNQRHSRCRGSSPRVRGTGLNRSLYGVPGRFIPARAGNSRWVSPLGSQTPVHPRACGEQNHQSIPRPAIPGSSPRVRGTGLRCAPDMFAWRFIPARAGNSGLSESVTKNLTVHPRACGEQTI